MYILVFHFWLIFFTSLTTQNMEDLFTGLFSICICMCAKSLQLCMTLCDSVNCSLPSSAARGILQARVLGWAAISVSIYNLYISSLVRCLLKFCPPPPFFFLSYFFLNMEFKRVFFILDSNFYQIHIMEIFSSSVVYLLVFLRVFFTELKILILMKSDLSRLFIMDQGCCI